MGVTIDVFQYGDSGDWPSRADGNGSSLEVIDLDGDLNDGDNWRGSTEYGGSPGSAGLGDFADVIVNEVLSHTDPPQVDAIELHNTSDIPVNVGGWWISDSNDDYFKFQIPANTILPKQGYLVFDESDFNSSQGVDPGDFALEQRPRGRCPI